MQRVKSRPDRPELELNYKCTLIVNQLNWMDKLNANAELFLKVNW